METEALPGINLDGVTVTFDGERERIVRNFGNVAVAAGFATIVVYLILFVQFNSFTQPLVILVTVPLSGVGSVLGLFIFRQPMSFMAILGMASPIGIVVNNAILLLDFINKARNKGYTVQDACVDAVKKRLRPIGLSTTTTVMGLTPLLLSGNPLFVPMSVSLMNGLLISTLLTLVVIPVVFSLVFGRKNEPASTGKRVEVD
jgi:multidrug efflux pump subunit AcrB